jgi:hypothetical protein
MIKNQSAKYAASQNDREKSVILSASRFGDDAFFTTYWLVQCHWLGKHSTKTTFSALFAPQF